MSVIQINKNNFESLKSESRTVLIDFYADWCGPCRMVSPIVDEIADERADLLVCKVNVDEQFELAGKYKVVSIPTLMVFNNGIVEDRALGARPKKQILAMLG